jgi:hypothetical protein
MEIGKVHKLDEVIELLNQHKDEFMLSFGGVLVTDRHMIIFNINVNESSVTIKQRPEDKNKIIIKTK